MDRLSGLRSDAQLPLAADQPQGARPRFAGPMRVDDNGRRWQVIDLEGFRGRSTSCAWWSDSGALPAPAHLERTRGEMSLLDKIRGKTDTTEGAEAPDTDLVSDGSEAAFDATRASDSILVGP